MCEKTVLALILLKLTKTGNFWGETRSPSGKNLTSDMCCFRADTTWLETLYPTLKIVVLSNTE
jgi:hypothetical protein